MKEPIRILQVVVSMNSGGIENMLMNLYRAIDRDKIQFDFLLHIEEESFFEKEIHQLGGKIHRVPALKLTSINSYLKSLDTFFQKENYQCVHSHISVVSYFVLKMAKKNNVKIRIAHSHEAHDSIWDHPLYKVPFILILRQVINKPLTHRFACGRDAGQWLFGKVPFKVINNAIDSKKFIYDEEIAAVEKEKLNLAGKTIFGNVGRFCAQKNHVFLIDVFEQLQKKMPDIHLLLVGDGELKPEIEKKVKEKNLIQSVSFLGVRKDVNRLLNAMDYMLMPSLFEGLPVSLVEAQANGLKVFASDKIAKETNLTGLIDFIPIKDKTTWVDHILNNLTYAREINYDKIVEANYDIKANAAFLTDFYLNVVAKG